MKKQLIALVVAVAVGFPLAFMAGMLLTPLWWRLEPVLGMELAGHSGPSEWLIWTLWAVIAVVLFLTARRVLRSS